MIYKPRSQISFFIYKIYVVLRLFKLQKSDRFWLNLLFSDGNIQIS